MRKLFLAVILLGAVADTASADAPRLIGMTKSTASCGCFDDTAIVVHLDRPVAALDVFWRSSTGRQEQRVTPDASGGFPIAQRTCSDAAVIPYGELDRGVVLGLTAIDADGTEHAVDNVPAIVDADDIRGPRRHMKVEYVDEIVRIAEPAPPSRTPTHGAIPLALVGVAALVGVRKGRAAARTSPELPRARVR